MLNSLSRVLRSSSPRGWFGLGEFATGETEAACYRDARQVETKLSATVSKYGSEGVAETRIDWSQWEAKIAHKEMVRSLREFYEAQMRAFESPLSAPSALSETVGDWSLFEAAKRGCETSVQASEEILRNGARALWISANNPPASLATQSEWLDSDQYWSAFVEKHMHYGNYLNTSVDPEAKETVANEEAALLKAWQIYDGRNVARMNNKLLYQRPSFEFYDVYRSPLVEHMVYFLARHGHDFRFFPETMHYAEFAQVYRHKWRVLDTLHARRAAFQRASLAREVPLELAPQGDLEHEGEKFYEDLIHKHNTLTEISVARLMGNYVFLSDAVPVASEAALLRVRRDFPAGGAFFDLGDDVSVLFFRPDANPLASRGESESESESESGASWSEEACPQEAWTRYLRHLRLSGKTLTPGEAELLGAFHELLAARKEGHDGRWFRASDESSAQAFLRRLRRDDPAREIFEKYVDELQTRWRDAKPLATGWSDEETLTQLVKTKATKYAAETREFETLALGLVESLQTEVRETTAAAEKKASDGTLLLVPQTPQTAEGADGAAVLRRATKEFEEEKEKTAQFLNALKTK